MDQEGAALAGGPLVHQETQIPHRSAIVCPPPLLLPPLPPPASHARTMPPCLVGQCFPFPQEEVTAGSCSGRREEEQLRAEEVLRRRVEEQGSGGWTEEEKVQVGRGPGESCHGNM